MKDFKGCDDPLCKNCYPAPVPEMPEVRCSCGNPACRVDADIQEEVRAGILAREQRNARRARRTTTVIQ